MSTRNRLDLQTLGSQPIMLKKIPRSLAGDVHISLIYLNTSISSKFRSEGSMQLGVPP